MRAGWRSRTSGSRRIGRQRPAASKPARWASRPRPIPTSTRPSSRQGHTRPTPSFGAPALVWHVAIWPRRSVDGVDEASEPCDPHDTAAPSTSRPSTSSSAAAGFGSQQINSFLARVAEPVPSEQGRRRRKQLRLVPPHDLHWQPSPADPAGLLQADRHPRAGDRALHAVVGRTGRHRRRGSRDAIRVCVHPEVNADYACISFYMDIGQAWNRPHAAAPDPRWVSGGAFSCKP